MTRRRTFDTDNPGAAPGRWRAVLTRVRVLARRAVGFGSSAEGDLTLMLKTAGAAGIAWAVAEWITGTPSPVLAPLAAVLVVQATIFQTMQSGFLRVVGVVLGVLLALVLGQWLGLNAWSLSFVLLLALLVGRMFRLGRETNQVAVSALLVLVVGGTASGYAQERVFETLVGTLVGGLVNVLVAPPVHVHAARDSIAAMARKIAGLLVDIGQRLADEGLVFAPSRTRELLWTARDFHDEIADIREQLDHASESLRYNPRHSVFVSLARKPEPAALLERVRAGTNAVDHIVDQTGGIARALVDVGEGRSGAAWDPAVTRRLGELVTSTGWTVKTWAQSLVANDPDAPEVPGAEGPRKRLVRDIEYARAKLATLSQELAAHRGESAGSTTMNWLVVGSVLGDISRILAEVDPGGGAHKAALSSTPPVHVHLRRPAFLTLRRRLRAARARLRRRR